MFCPVTNPSSPDVSISGLTGTHQSIASTKPIPPPAQIRKDPPAVQRVVFPEKAACSKCVILRLYRTIGSLAPVCRSCSQASQKAVPNRESRPKSVSLLIWPTPPPPPENLSNTTRLAAGNGCGYLKVQARRRGRGKRAKLVGRFCLRPQ